MAILTYAQTKAQIAKIRGRSTDTNLLNEAGEEIARIFEELTLEDFSWLITESTIPIVASTQDYDLPATYRRMYSVRLSTANRPLAYIDQREWDRFVLDHSEEGTAAAYTIIRTTNTQEKLRIFPIPGTADTATIRFHRALVTPSVDGNAIDFLEKYQAYIVYQGRANLLFAHTDQAAGEYWQARADRLFRKMKHEDQDADRQAAFRQGDAIPLPSDHPSAWLYDW